MLTNQGLNKFAIAIANVVQNGQVGTSLVEPSASDTSLQNPISGTIKPVTKNNPTANRVSINYELSTSEANGNNISEFGLFASDNTLLSRFIFNPFNKTSDNSLTIRCIVDVVQK